MYKRLLFYFIGLKVATLFVALYWVTQFALVTPEVMISRTGYEVYFNPVGAIEVKTDTWTHIFDLKIPIMQYSNDITTEGFTCNGLPFTPNLTTCSDDNNIFSSVDSLHQRAAIKVNSLIKRISQILTIDKAERRKQRHDKRGLINFVGTLAHSLFGLVTDSVLEAFGERFKTVFNNQERLLGQFDANHNQLTSATSITNKRLDAIHTHIQTQDKTLSDLSNAVQIDFQTSLRLILYLAEATSKFDISGNQSTQFINGRGIFKSWTLGPWSVTSRRHWACLCANY